MLRNNLILIIIAIACWTTYSDLSSGSLPAQPGGGRTTQASAPEHTAEIAYKRIKAGPGDTLLSISEQVNRKLPSMERLIKDFLLLNPSADPNHLHKGKIYSFPVYDDNSSRNN